MNKIKHGLSIVRNDAGQALTEFAIVIPIVFMFYFAMLQWVQITETAQLVNYAAYAAARAYIVEPANTDQTTAESDATDAAALALAPVARLAPGEILPLTPTMSIGSFPDFLSLGYGFVVARELRLNPQFGGNINFSTASAVGNWQQINVVVNYPQPIYMPGLSELWGIVGWSGSSLGKGTDIHQDLTPLQQGLVGLAGAGNSTESYIVGAEPSAFKELFPDIWEQFASQVAGIVEGIVGTVLPFPYVNVTGKCSMAIEKWGEQPQWLPREPGPGA